MVIPGATMAREVGIDNSAEIERGTRRTNLPLARLCAVYLWFVCFSPIARDPLLRDNQGGEVVDNRRTLVRADWKHQQADVFAMARLPCRGNSHVFY
jgi:hypothetical protein